MNPITEAIRNRRSVRTYDGRPLTAEDRAQLSAFAETIENPWHIPVRFKLLEAKEHGLVCPVAVGTALYIGGKVRTVPHACAAFGYTFEALILQAQAMGIGTVWLGGTMNRAAFEQAMELEEDEMMPCASALGYPAEKMSLRESMMRKSIKADERLPFDTLFFDKNFDTPLTEESAGIFAEPLRMVRLAPSAVNKQPWRAVVSDRTVHFYLKRSKGFHHDGKLDMQMIDLGIALCHFALTAESHGLQLHFTQQTPDIPAAPDLEYIASYSIQHA